MRNVFVNLRSRVALLGSLLVCLAVGGFATAQLPPAIQADRYLVQAERELGSGDPATAVATLDRIMALQAEHGLDIPEVFWIRRAQASYDAGLHDLTIESIVRYLEITGQEGEHYVTALELYDAAELAKEQAAERAAALAAEAERLAAERVVAEAERAAVAAAALPAAMPEMVVIPAGTFRMGCVSGQDCEDDEFPVHDVTIPEAFTRAVTASFTPVCTLLTVFVNSDEPSENAPPTTAWDESVGIVWPTTISAGMLSVAINEGAEITLVLPSVSLASRKRASSRVVRTSIPMLRFVKPAPVRLPASRLAVPSTARLRR